MFERIKNLFFQRKVNKIVEEAIKDQQQEIHKKWCPYCKQLKPVTEFNKNRTKNDWLQSQCKECHKWMREKKGKKYKFTPSRKEFYGWYINTSERYITYERNGGVYVIVDSFRYSYLVGEFGEDLVKTKITQMIKYNNRNNLWNADQDLYYKLRNRCQKEKILINERQNGGLF